MSNETRAYTLLIQTLENSNRTQTTSDRWIISVLSILTCITSINMYWAWQIDRKLTTKGPKEQKIEQNVNQHIGSQDGIFEQIAKLKLKEQQNGRALRQLEQPEVHKADGNGNSSEQ